MYQLRAPLIIDRMAAHHSDRSKREAAGIALNEFARQLGISPAYWSRIEREMEKPPKDELIEGAIKLLKLGGDRDRVFIEADRMPPEMQKDLPRVIQAYRRLKQEK